MLYVSKFIVNKEECTDKIKQKKHFGYTIIVECINNIK